MLPKKIFILLFAFSSFTIKNRVNSYALKTFADIYQTFNEVATLGVASINSVGQEAKDAAGKDGIGAAYEKGKVALSLQGKTAKIGAWGVFFGAVADEVNYDSNNINYLTMFPNFSEGNVTLTPFESFQLYHDFIDKMDTSNEKSYAL